MDPADPHNLHDTADHEILERIQIAIAGNHTDESLETLRAPLMKIDGVKSVTADVLEEVINISFDVRKAHAADLHEAILQSGYKAAAIPAD